MSQTRHRKPAAPSKRRSPVSLALLIAGLLILAAAAFFAIRNNQGGSTGSGTPKISVDKKEINFGDQHFGQSASAVFKITNTGISTLKITEVPTVEAKEGC